MNDTPRPNIEPLNQPCTSELLYLGDLVERVDIGGLGIVVSVGNFKDCLGGTVWQYSIEPLHDGFKSAWFFRRDLSLVMKGPARTHMRYPLSGLQYVPKDPRKITGTSHGYPTTEEDKEV